MDILPGLQQKGSHLYVPSFLARQFLNAF